MRATIEQFLTNKQINQCLQIYKNTPDHKQARRIQELVIEPNLGLINQKLGQENDSLFLAYAVLYVFQNSGCFKTN